MFKLTIFEALLVTHFIVDWFFQGRWEAMNKSKKWLPLFFHCIIYTIGFIPVFLIYKINLIWLILLFISHVIFDKRTFEIWLLKNLKGVTKENTSEFLWTILLTTIDQILHIVILMLVIIFS